MFSTIVGRPSAALIPLLTALLMQPAVTAQDARLAPVRIALGENTRAPLPPAFDVLQVAASQSSVWFLGIDRSVSDAQPSIYRWTALGVTRASLPPNVTARSIHATRGASGAIDAAFIVAADGELYRENDASFERVESPAPVEAVTGRRFTWLRTRDNRVRRLSASGVDDGVAIPGAIDAWTETVAGDLIVAFHDDSAAGLVRLSASDLALSDVRLAHSGVLPRVSSVYSDSSDVLWVAFADGTVAREFAGVTDWFDYRNGFPLRPVAHMLEDRWGTIFFVPEQHESEPATISSLGLTGRYSAQPQFATAALGGFQGPVLGATEDGFGGIWIALGANGAHRLQTLAPLQWMRGSQSRPAAPEASELKSSARGGASAFAATVHNSATVTSKSAESITGIGPYPGGRLTNLNSSLGLVSNVVGCVVTDGKGNVYFGTGYENQGDDPASPGAGISRWNHRSMTNYTTANGLPSNTVNACAYDAASDRLWFGTSNGVARMVPSTGAITVFLGGNKVQDIAFAGGSVFVGTYNAGVFRLDPSSGAVQGQFNVGNNKVTSLGANNAGALYAGVWGSGVHSFNGTSWAQVSTPAGASALVQDIEFDSSNNLWISVWNSGVYRRTPGGTSTLFNSASGLGTAANRAYKIERDGQNNLWFSHSFSGETAPKASVTFLPAAQVTAASPAFARYTTANGIPSNTILGLGADGNTGMWLGVPGGGVFRIGCPCYSPGWPQQLTGQAYFSSPLLVDLDNNKTLEVVVGDVAGWVHAFRPDGSLLWKFDTRAAFPGQTTGQMSVQSSVAAGDVDGDGEIELVVGLGGQEINGNVGQGGILILSRAGAFKRIIYTLDTIGATQLLEDGVREGVFATPVLANMDSDPELEIMVGAFDLLLYALNGDGTPIYQNDEDGDGRFDEDFLGDATPYTPGNSSDNFPGIRLVDDDGDGRIDEGHPSDDDEDGRFDEDYPEWPTLARDSVVASAAVFDFFNTGSKNVVFGHDYTGGPNMEFGRGGVLRVLDRFGDPLPGFPIGDIEQVVWSSPVVVDLDNDGAYEIIHGTGLDLSTVGSTPAESLIGQAVYAWRRDGSSFKPGQNGKFATTEGRSFASFAVGDLDNDGSPELVISTTSLRNKASQTIDAAGSVVDPSQARGQLVYAFRTDGSVVPGFPVRPNALVPATNVVGSPILVDVNGDGFLDIVVPASTGIHVLDRTGQSLSGMGSFENLQDNRFNEIASTPAIGDIDLDGRLELVWAIPGINGKGEVLVVKLGAPNATMSRSWPQWRRGANRNGVFAPLIGLVQGYESGGTLNLTVEAFGGRAPLGSVTINGSSVGGSASLTLSDAGAGADPVANDARYSAAINVASVAPGRYALPVRVTDQSGQSDTQTLIFVKRAAGGGRLTVSHSTLSFGVTRQDDALQEQITLVNLGEAAVTLNSITSNSPEFVVASPTQMPISLAPGAVQFVTIRFRPSSARGARSAALTINSTDASAPVRTVTLTGSTDFGAQAGCTYTLTPGQTLGVPYTGLNITFQVNTAPGCAWDAQSNRAWAQVYPLNGVGPGAVTFNVFPNFSTRPRAAIANVSGSLHTIAQNGGVGSIDERFVAQMYFAIFGRVPSQAEINFQVTQGLNAGLSRAQLLRNFFNSAEFNNNGRFVAGIYVGILNRNAEYGGWLFQRNALATNVVTQLQLVSNFINSAEYKLVFGTPSLQEYVRLLYRYILLREPAQHEVDFQANAVTNGLSREQLAVNFLNSAEFRVGTGPRLTAFLLYSLILQRDPTPAERTLRESQIAAGADVTALMAEILASSEFTGLLF